MQRSGTPLPGLAPGTALAVVVDPDALVEAIARRAVELLGECQEPAEPEPYIGVKEAARYLACDEQRVYDLRSQRRLHCIKDGGRLLTRRSWIDDYLNKENA
jgi:excisionase family DNA binding protein